MVNSLNTWKVEICPPPTTLGDNLIYPALNPGVHDHVEWEVVGGWRQGLSGLKFLLLKGTRRASNKITSGGRCVGVRVVSILLEYPTDHATLVE